LPCSENLITLLVDRKGEEIIRKSECCSNFLRSLRFYLFVFLITELLRLEGASGDHLVSPPSPKQGQLQQIVSEPSLVRFRIQGMETLQLLWAICSSVSPLSQQKIFMFRWKFLYFNLCPLAEKSLDPSSLLPPVRYLIVCSIALADSSNLQLDSNPAQSSRSTRTLALSALKPSTAPCTQTYTKWDLEDFLDSGACSEEI